MKRAIVIAALVARISTADARWYGHEIAASDALGVGSFYLLGKVTDDKLVEGPLLIGGVFFTLVGPELVHAHEGHSDAIWKSLAVRVGAPTLGAIIGQMFDTSGDHAWTLGNGASAGLALGYLSAVIVDVALLAHAPGDPTAPRIVSLSFPL